MRRDTGGNPMMRLYAGSAIALVAAMLGAMAYLAYTRGNGDDAFAECRGSNVAGGTGSIGGPFTLVNAEGRTVTDADVITEPSLVYFGYTFCPDVCPLDTSRNAEAVDVLEEMGISATPVFISIDPERDTPEVVGDFAANLHPKMIGLTGSPEQIKAASQAYRTYYKKQEGDPDYYLVDHSTFTYLVLPEHGFVEFFRRETTADDMASSVACFAGLAG
jgi:protein SCO1/2